MPGNSSVKPQIMHARCEASAQWAAELTGKIEDNLACLRGDVNGGAEKKQGYRTS
jgi:hypothetical protein